MSHSQSQFARIPLDHCLCKSQREASVRSTGRRLPAGGSSPRNFYRVFEQSEILSYARFVVRLALGLRGADPHMTEVKVHLFEGVGVRAHSMQDLASKLDTALQHPATVELR